MHPSERPDCSRRNDASEHDAEPKTVTDGSTPSHGGVTHLRNVCDQSTGCECPAVVRSTA